VDVKSSAAYHDLETSFSVTDPSLAKVSGVAIRAANDASNLGFSTETHESGETYKYIPMNGGRSCASA